MAVLLEIIFQIGCDSQFWKKLLKWSHRRSESPVHLCSRYCVVALIFLFLFNAILFCLIAFYMFWFCPRELSVAYFASLRQVRLQPRSNDTAVQRQTQLETKHFSQPQPKTYLVLADGSVGNGWSFVNAVSDSLRKGPTSSRRFPGSQFPRSSTAKLAITSWDLKLSKSTGCIA